MRSYLTSVRNQWSTALADARFRVESVLSVLILILILIGASRFFLWVEARPGVVVYDPLLVLLHPANLTWVTFSIIYTALILVTIGLARTPSKLVAAIQSYILLTLFRIVLMWSLPLDPPPTAIPLSDPFVEMLGTGKPLTRDLFFSGHTSFMFLLYLVCDTKLRPLLLASTFLVGACVLLQHVHYTVDVLAAPFVAYASFRLVQQARSRFGAATP